MRVMVVVLDARTPKERMRATRALINFAFDNFETHRLYAAGAPVVQADVAQGAQNTVALGLSDDLFLTVRRGDGARLRSQAEVFDRLTAPLATADAAGELKISLDGETVATRPLHPLTAVERGRWWNRLMNGDQASATASEAPK
jgi:D-alanyl-D-alanine carboxypeptidase (penicillin-binding protein 5/6)